MRSFHYNAISKTSKLLMINSGMGNKQGGGSVVFLVFFSFFLSPFLELSREK